jgi:hypothetical protein
MPANWVKGNKEKEKSWKKAKKAFKKSNKKKESDWSDKEWAQVMAIAKKIYNSKNESVVWKEKVREYLGEADNKWMQKASAKLKGSLREIIGVKKGEKIEDVSDSKIKSIIQKNGTKVERKLIAYANFMGSQGKKKEKDRILKIVRNTKNASK